MEVVFWASLTIAAYALIGYPLIATVIGLTQKPRQMALSGVQPKVSVIIACYNEQAAIGEKLEQLRESNYPSELLELIVVLDGSTDQTGDVVRSKAALGVRLVECTERRGKTRTLDDGVAVAKGDVLVFADATGVYEPDTLRELVEPFQDPTVGCVSGRVVYEQYESSTAVGHRGYKQIDEAMRRGEISFGFLASVCGSIHAMRREIYCPVDSDMTRDITDPIQAVAAGFRVVHAEHAVAVEEPFRTMRAHSDARLRMTVRGLRTTPYALSQLIRAGNWMSIWIYASHKLLRWWLWIPLLGMLVSSLALASSPFYLLAALGQLSLYGLGSVALWRAQNSKPKGIASAAAFFVMQTVAMARGCWNWLRGDSKPIWNPDRQTR